MADSIAGSTTIGDTGNEVTTSYKTRSGAHHIRLFNQVSPDILLVHQSKMFGFKLAVGDATDLEPIPRTTKAEILRDLSRA